MRELIALLLIVSGCSGTTPTPSASPVSATVACVGGDSGTGVTLTLTYEIIQYTNGDRQVECTVENNTGAYTWVQYYKSSAGITAGNTCLVTADVDAASGGFWTFTSQNGVTKAVYSDSGSAHNNYSYAFTACTTTN